LPFGGIRVAGKIMPVDQDPPLGRGEKRGKHPLGGRFSGAVRSEKSKNLAPLDGEVDVVHRQEFVIIFGQVFYFNGVVHNLFSFSAITQALKLLVSIRTRALG